MNALHPKFTYKASYKNIFLFFKLKILILKRSFSYVGMVENLSFIPF